MQGFTLNPNGTAQSVNMATLLIKNWNLDNKTLTLQYESIGNKQTIMGTDTLSITKIDADSLILSKNTNVIWRMGSNCQFRSLQNLNPVYVFSTASYFY